MKIKSKAKFVFTVLGLMLYVISSLYWSRAEPTGASLTLIGIDNGSATAPGSRQDPGGKIITLNITAVQQDQAWKAYVGDITGSLVLRNTNGFSIYAWTLNASQLQGNIFVTRASSVNWTPIKCANVSWISTEDSYLGSNSAASDSINRTFTYTAHKTMTISGVGAISNDTCRSTATYVNGSAQTVTSASAFQEILLTDDASFIYATFIDQDKQGFDNNATDPSTYDFQLIVGENRTDATGHVYYFYADIS